MRQPSLRGAVTVQFVVGRWGDALSITVDGAGDAPLHDCIRTALGLVVTTRLPQAPIDVRLELALDPQPAEWPTAEAALEAGDADGAATRFAKDSLAARTPAEACRARLGIVRAYAIGSFSADVKHSEGTLILGML